MATLKEIADHLGISFQNVSKDLKKMGVDWRDKSLDEIRLLYLARLRSCAAGHSAPGAKVTLMDVRIEKEQLEKRLLQLKVAREEEQLVDISQLLPELQSLIQGFKVKLLGLATVIKTNLDAQHEIDVDLDWLETILEDTLVDFSKYIGQHRVALKEQREREQAKAV